MPTSSSPTRRRCARRPSKGAPRLRLVAVAATGTDVVDVKACAARGVDGLQHPQLCGQHRARAHLRADPGPAPQHPRLPGIGAAGRWQAAAQFCYFDHPIRDLAGSTLGIIGDGVLGKSVAELGEAFGMKVLFSDYKGTTGMGPLYTPFADVIRLSDVITLHSPLTALDPQPDRGARVRAMEQQPLLINTARGGLVDEDALYDALTTGQIAGAGFDVVTAEPPPPDHKLMRLLELPELHPDPARGLGEPGGDPGPGRPAGRQCRGLLGRQPAQRRGPGLNRKGPA